MPCKNTESINNDSTIYLRQITMTSIIQKHCDKSKILNFCFYMQYLTLGLSIKYSLIHVIRNC